ncbi:hypothetical protein [Hoeflea alexandrii]|uniref:Uncharacterized protein n=1 Tax=Hoeflea alexandrii TaxID=288436 RepID=A0ABT1CW15_9HYPH|nr:hypothetical protein [Hoeflea alexandrii]MCO6410123.1 hypothetical protein [Hoeflea alexandrii]MCY0153095.1 hypothetical protein [Hoeflea alexandrii]
MWRLFVPLRYLRISHPEKIKFDLIFPVCFALLISLPLLSDRFLTDAKALDVLGRSSDLLSVLTGFFVAALAAVATFGNPEMDSPMTGSAPVSLNDRTGEPVPLSRRRFLSYLFGYLALLSIATYILGFGFFALQSYVVDVTYPDYSTASFVVFWLVYALLLGNLLSNALLGLFYLTDRIHRPNRVVRFQDRSRGTTDQGDEAA